MEYNLRYSDTSIKNDTTIGMHMNTNKNMTMNMNTDLSINTDIDMIMKTNTNMNTYFSNELSGLNDINEFTEIVETNDYHEFSNLSTETGGKSLNNIFNRKSIDKEKSHINTNIPDLDANELYNSPINDLTIELNEIIKLSDNLIKCDCCDQVAKPADNNFNNFNYNYNYETIREKRRHITRHSKLMGDLSLHVSSKTENKVLICPYCEKLFTRKSNLSSHIRTHSIVKPYECSVCNKSFARQSDLRRHKSIHINYKKFQCRGLLKNGKTWGCGNFYSRSDGLRKHFRSRSGKKCISDLTGEINFENVGGNENGNEKIKIDYLSKAFQNTRLFDKIKND